MCMITELVFVQNGNELKILTQKVWSIGVTSVLLVKGQLVACVTTLMDLRRHVKIPPTLNFCVLTLNGPNCFTGMRSQTVVEQGFKGY